MTNNKRREQENKDLIARMRRGESLSLIDPAATFFPPRPVVVKDFKEMARVMGLTPSENGAEACQPPKTSPS